MLTKEIIQKLIEIHGSKKIVKVKFNDLVKAKLSSLTPPSQYPVMIQSVLISMGLSFNDGYKLNSNTANSVHSKLDNS